MLDDSDTNGSWDSDIRYERDLNREVRSAHRTMSPRFQAAYDNTMGAVHAYITARLDRCAQCGRAAHASETDDAGVCVDCLGFNAVFPEPCSAAFHDAGWDGLRRDGLMAYAEDLVLDHRTCTKCHMSFSREVDINTHEAVEALRKGGL